MGAPSADWVDSGKLVGSSSTTASPVNEEASKRGGEGGGRQKCDAWKSEGFMNPRCAGLDRLCRISVFEQDGKPGGCQIIAKSSAVGEAAAVLGLGIK